MSGSRAGFSLPDPSAAELGALKAAVASQLSVPVSTVTAAAQPAQHRRALETTAVPISLQGESALLTCNTDPPVAFPLTWFPFREENDCSQFPHPCPLSSAVMGIPPTDAAVRLAASVLSSGATLAKLLEAAGFPTDAAAVQPSPPTTTVKANVIVLVEDMASGDAAAEELAAALAAGAYTAAVQKTFAGAVVVADGAPAVLHSPSTVFVPAAGVQTCTAIGLNCFPGVQCVLPSIVEAANGVPIQCGSCPPGYTGARISREQSRWSCFCSSADFSRVECVLASTRLSRQASLSSAQATEVVATTSTSARTLRRATQAPRAPTPPAPSRAGSAQLLRR